SIWVIPRSTASRRTATAPSWSAGGPITPGPANCIAPYPNFVTVKPPDVQVPPGSVVGVTVTRINLPRGVRGVSAPAQFQATGFRAEEGTSRFVTHTAV